MELFVPGRLCLFGEHSDWAGAWRSTHPEVHVGQCLVAGIGQGLRAEVRALPDPVFSMTTPGPDGVHELIAGLDELATIAEDRGFFSYAAGVAAEIHERHRLTSGLSLHVTDTDLPLARGLSSSAAACVLVARAFGRVHDLGLSVEDEMDLAYRGERRAGSECGRMDQACALGRRASVLTFDGEDMSIEPLHVGAPIPLLVVDLQAAKDTRRILSDLQACFPDRTDSIAGRVREALGPRNATLLRAAREALEAGDAPRLGEHMTEAQAVFDADVAPACEELAAPRLHELLGAPEARELAWGGKGVGSQGDGCAQLVVRSSEEGRELGRLLEERLAIRWLSFTLGGE
ncbi:MAG: GHMP kinase [Acidobacteriota bacterium]